MRKFLFIYLVWPVVCFSASAPAPVSFDLVNVPIVKFCEAIYRTMLGRDYVISPNISDSASRLTIHVKSMNVSDVPDFVENLLGKQGIVVNVKDGIFYLDQVVSNEPALPLDKNVLGVDASSFMPVGNRLSDDSALINARDPFAKVDIRSQMQGVSENQHQLNLESVLYVAKNHPVELLVEVINSGYPKGAVVVGDKLILNLPHERMQKAIELLEQVDAPRKSVEISVSWVEVTNTRGSNTGISVAAGILGSKFSASLGTINSGSQLSLTGTNFQFVLDALRADSNVKQITNTKMLGDDNEKINFSVGDEVPTIGSTTQSNAGNPTQNIVYRNSGVIVDVVPRILGNGRIHLVLDGQISNFQTTDTGVAASPTLVKRQLKTVVTIGDGDVLLLGGLNSTNDSKSVSGFSFLPASWGLRNDSAQASDLVMVLSAKVVQ